MHVGKKGQKAILKFSSNIFLDFLNCIEWQLFDLERETLRQLLFLILRPAEAIVTKVGKNIIIFHLLSLLI